MCCGRVGVDVIKTLDKSLGSQVGVHYPFGVKSLNLAKLLSKPSCYSVMDRIDTLAFLKSLELYLVDCLDKKWMQSTQCFHEVGHIFVHYSKNVIIKSVNLNFVTGS